MKYVVILTIPDDDDMIDGDDSIDAVCRDANDLFDFFGASFSVRPLSEEIAC